MAWVESNFPSDCGIVWGGGTLNAMIIANVPPIPSHTHLGSYSRRRLSLFFKVGCCYILFIINHICCFELQDWIPPHPALILTTRLQDWILRTPCLSTSSILTSEKAPSIVLWDFSGPAVTWTSTLMGENNSRDVELRTL